MEDLTARTRAFWDEAFNGRDLSRIEYFVAPDSLMGIPATASA
jgi:hypothetical protein